MNRLIPICSVVVLSLLCHGGNAERHVDKHHGSDHALTSKPAFALFYADKDKTFAEELEVARKALEDCNYDVRTFDIGAIPDLNRTLSEAGLPVDTPVIYTASHSYFRAGESQSFESYLLDADGHKVSPSKFLSSLKTHFPRAPKYIDTCHSGLFSELDSTTASACGQGQKSQVDPKTKMTPVEAPIIQLFCDAIAKCDLIHKFDKDGDRALAGNEIEDFLLDRHPEAASQSIVKFGVFFDEASAKASVSNCKPPSTSSLDPGEEDVVVYQEEGKDPVRGVINEIVLTKGIMPLGRLKQPSTSLKSDYLEIAKNNPNYSFSDLLKDGSNNKLGDMVSMLLTGSPGEVSLVALPAEGRNKFAVTVGNKRSKATLNWELRKIVYRPTCSTPDGLSFELFSNRQSPNFPKDFKISCKSKKPDSK